MSDTLKRRIAALEETYLRLEGPDTDHELGDFLADLLESSHWMMYDAALSGEASYGPRTEPGWAARLECLAVLNVVREREGLPPLALAHENFHTVNATRNMEHLSRTTPREWLRLARVQSTYFFWPKWGGEEGRKAILTYLEAATEK